MSCYGKSLHSGECHLDRPTGSVACSANSRVRKAGPPCPLAKVDVRHPASLRVATLNVGTLRDKEPEVVETISRRRIDLCCLQEIRLPGSLDENQTREVRLDDHTMYKLYFSGSKRGLQNGVGILLAERWIDKVISVKRFSDRMMLLKLVIGGAVFTFTSLYAPQKSLPRTVKTQFYDSLQDICMAIPSSEALFCLGDWNGHVGADACGYRDVHGGHGFGKRNAEGECVLEFALANGLLVGNTQFIKRKSHLITYQSGGNDTQIDYVLYPKSFCGKVTNVKVIPGEACAPQHRLLVCDLRVNPPPPQQKRKFTPRLRTWRLRDPATASRFHEAVRERLGTDIDCPSVESAWSNLKTSLLDATKEVCGLSRNHHWRKETWWWNDQVETAVSEKRAHFKAYNTLRKRGTTPEALNARTAYLEAKRAAKHAVRLAKSEAEAVKFRDIDTHGSGIYRLARQMDRTNQDIVGEKCIKNDAGELALSDTDKMKAWVEHYSRLLNVEFDWPRELLPDVAPNAGDPPLVTTEQILSALGKMKCGKAAGPSGITAEMLTAAGPECIELVRQLAERVFSGDPIPKDWEESYILNLYKGKGDALDRGNYRGLKLTDQVMKLLERVLDSSIRSMVDIDEMQFGFVPGRGTTDAIFIARQLQEKYIAAKKPLYFAFVDLEKAFDRVPREVLWWAMRSLGVEEWAVRAVQNMYSNARSRVRVNGQYSDEFNVRVGVHQGSVLSPLLFILVLEALSRKFPDRGAPWELLYADDLCVSADTKEKCIERLRLWKEEMESKGLRVNMKKTKIMVSGPGLDVLKDSGKHTCAVCRDGVDRPAIPCTSCGMYVHGNLKCGGVRPPLKREYPGYICLRCQGKARPIDGRPFPSVQVDGSILDVEGEFCYLGDVISAGGGCLQAIGARCSVAWGKFKRLLPILTSKNLSLPTRGRVYNSCVRTAMLHGSETWAPRVADTRRLQRTDRAMIRWICGARLSDRTPSGELLTRLGLEDITSVLRSRRLRWHGHVARASGCIHTVTEMVVPNDSRGKGRPPLAWRDCVKRDIHECGLLDLDPLDRAAWRAGVNAARLQPTPIAGN